MPGESSVLHSRVLIPGNGRYARRVYCDNPAKITSFSGARVRFIYLQFDSVVMYLVIFNINLVLLINVLVACYGYRGCLQPVGIPGR